MSDEPVRNGRYRHFKGGDYTVIGVARHSETDEELVVYRANYGDRGLWVRPKEMFLDEVRSGENLVPRFQFVAGDEVSEAIE